MVRSEETFKYICEVCDAEFDLEKEAEECESIHKNGIIKTIYLHGRSNVSEYMGNYDLDESNAKLLQDLFYEVEFLVLFKENKSIIVGLNGKYITDLNKIIDAGDTYDPEDFK